MPLVTHVTQPTVRGTVHTVQAAPSQAAKEFSTFLWPAGPLVLKTFMWGQLSHCDARNSAEMPHQPELRNNTHPTALCPAVCPAGAVLSAPL